MNEFDKEIKRIRDLDPDDALLNDLYPRDDWKYDVNNGDTVLGYYEWVVHQVETNSCPVCGELGYPDPEDCSFCEDQRDALRTTP